MEKMRTPSATWPVPELLRPDNYEKWSDLMELYLVSIDLWDVVKPQDDEDEETKEWIKRDASALLAIKSSCGEEMFSMIKPIKSAKEAWKKLADDYQDQHNRPTVHPVKRGPTCEWEKILYGIIQKGSGKIEEKLDNFFKDHEDGNPTAGLHMAITAAHSDSLTYLICSCLLKRITKIDELVETDENNNTLLSNVVHHRRNNILKLLMKKIKALPAGEAEMKKLMITEQDATEQDANGKIPVQLACESGQEDMTQLLYQETPSDFLNPDNGDHGFHLLKECISKKMLGIALHLLYEFPKLTLRRCQNLDNCLVTLSRMSESPFSAGNQLAFWSRLLYYIMQFNVCFRGNNESPRRNKELNDPENEGETGFVVYFSITGFYDTLPGEWKVSSVLKPASIQLTAAADADDDDKEINLEAGQNHLIPKPDDPQERDVEQADQAAGEIGLGIQTRNVDKSGPTFGERFLEKTILIASIAVSGLLMIPIFSLLLPLIVASGVTFGILVEILVFLGIILYILGFISWKKIWTLKLNQVYANEILGIISSQLEEVEQEKLEETGAMSAAIQATKNSIPEIAIKFAQGNNNIVWNGANTKDPERNLFVLAVTHRQAKLASYLYELRIKDLTNVNDKYGNNVLHIAAKLAPHAQLAHISGAALQLQSELRWFKAVEGIVPQFYRGDKNKKEELPLELFVIEHKDLIKEAEDWIKKSAESSTVVAALIITIMFAAAFTVPGGNNQDTGLPIFEKAAPFLVFIIADAISLFAAATSVLMFLGILTSRYALEDFLRSLPLKLVFGLSSLFISIAAMMAAFCAALFIMLQGRLQVVVPVTCLAGVPVASFVLLQFHLLLEILSATYSSNIFKTKRPNILARLREMQSILDSILGVNAIRNKLPRSSPMLAN